MARKKNRKTTGTPPNRIEAPEVYVIARSRDGGKTWALLDPVDRTQDMGTVLENAIAKAHDLADIANPGDRVILFQPMTVYETPPTPKANIVWMFGIEQDD